MNEHRELKCDPSAILSGVASIPVLTSPQGMPITALVLAGSRGTTDPVAVAEGVTNKALVQVGSSTMLERVIVALREAGVQQVFVSTDNPCIIAVAHGVCAAVVKPGTGPSESVSLALDQVGAPLLVTTADHALLSPNWIRDFVAGAPIEVDVAIMLARQEDVLQAVPGNRRTWLRFADGAWSGCNLFLLATPRAGQAVDQWCLVESERKRPWRLAARLGWTTFFEYLRGRLSLADAIGHVGHRMGVIAALVPASHGLAAVDVDKVEDLALVRAIVAGRRPSSLDGEIDAIDVAGTLLTPFVQGRGGRGARVVKALGGLERLKPWLGPGHRSLDVAEP